MSSYVDKAYYQNIYNKFENNSIDFNNYLDEFSLQFKIYFYVDDSIDKNLSSDIINVAKEVLSKHGINMFIRNIKYIKIEDSETLYTMFEDVKKQYDNPIDSGFDGLFMCLLNHKHNKIEHDPAGFHTNMSSTKGQGAVNIYIDQYYMPFEIKRDIYILSKARTLLHEIGHYLGAGHDLDEYDGTKSIMYTPAQHIKYINHLFYSNKSMKEIISMQSVDRYMKSFDVNLTINDNIFLIHERGNMYHYKFKISEGTLEDIIVYYHPYNDEGSLIKHLEKNNIKYTKTFDELSFIWYQDKSQKEGWYSYISVVNKNNNITFSNPVIIILK